MRLYQTHSPCERFIGTARRECLDWVMPINEQHLRRVLAEWISHSNDVGARSPVCTMIAAWSRSRLEFLRGTGRPHAARIVAHERPTLSAPWRGVLLDTVCFASDKAVHFWKG